MYQNIIKEEKLSTENVQPVLTTVLFVCRLRQLTAGATMCNQQLSRDKLFMYIDLGVLGVKGR